MQTYRCMCICAYISTYVCMITHFMNTFTRIAIILHCNYVSCIFRYRNVAMNFRLHCIRSNNLCRLLLFNKNPFNSKCSMIVYTFATTVGDDAYREFCENKHRLHNQPTGRHVNINKNNKKHNKIHYKPVIRANGKRSMLTERSLKTSAFLHTHLVMSVCVVCRFTCKRKQIRRLGHTRIDGMHGIASIG